MPRMPRRPPERAIAEYHDSVTAARPAGADDAAMNPNDTAIGETAKVDERFVDDWVRFGLSELESYLGKHARFDAYCSRRDADSTEL
jgi:hypothetical protein